MKILPLREARVERSALGHSHFLRGLSLASSAIAFPNSEQDRRRRAIAEA